ncbi:MAG: hypothetical protein Kow0020_06600 [Wenzhouxiangellaceae bacterium]
MPSKEVIVSEHIGRKNRLTIQRDRRVSGKEEVPEYAATHRIDRDLLIDAIGLAVEDQQQHRVWPELRDLVYRIREQSHAIERDPVSDG